VHDVLYVETVKSIVCTGLYSIAHFQTVRGTVEICSNFSTDIQHKKFDEAYVRSRPLQSLVLSQGICHHKHRSKICDVFSDSCADL
jgi:hypothetical protein